MNGWCQDWNICKGDDVTGGSETPEDIAGGRNK